MKVFNKPLPADQFVRRFRLIPVGLELFAEIFFLDNNKSALIDDHVQKRVDFFPAVDDPLGVSKLARSRPVTLEEFERILTCVPKVRARDPELGVSFLKGLWEGGFRLEELVRLSWDSGQPLSIDAAGKFPLVRILSEGEKAHHDRLQPITPEFWDLLCETPLEKRYGPAFPLPCGSKRACRIVSDIGRRAGVVTDPSSGKCATSHDIGRRALTTRLGECLTESQLAQWMRHESPETTRQYYNLPTAMSLSAKLWENNKNA